MRSKRTAAGVFLMLMLAACSPRPGTGGNPPGQRTSQPGAGSSPAPTSSRPESPPPTRHTAAPAAAGTTGWPTYRDQRFGFAVSHPPGWRVLDATRPPRGPTVTLQPAGGSRGVVIEITAPPSTAQPQLSNVYCRPVKIGELPGTRCLDTIAGLVMVTLTWQSHQYAISYSLRSPATGTVAEQITQSFRPVG